MASRTSKSKNVVASPVERLLSITRALSDAVDELTFSSPVTHVYNPLQYAWLPHECYLRRYGEGRDRVVLLGMNPGPFGMAQVGVPFGEVSLVKHWLGIEAPVSKPKVEHPARPITGFDCARSEVSGARLWGWAKDRFVTPEQFFSRYFVVNYCPLVFMGHSGKNITPDKLPSVERAALFGVCDAALREICDVIAPQRVIGIGSFAFGRAKLALEENVTPVGQILHPSPASPKANTGWARLVEEQLTAMGVRLPRG